MPTDLLATRAQIIDKLLTLKQTREAKNAATTDDKALTEEVKMWMDLNDETELFDGEHGILATLKSSSTTTWDIRTAPPALLARLAVEGLLTVNTTAFNERRKSAPATYLDDTLAYRHEGETRTLRIEKK